LELSQVEAAQADPECFSVLYEKYYRQIFVFIFRRTDDETLSADLCSVTFLKAMLHIRKFRYRGLPFSSWLFRIAFNEVNMHFRKTKNERCVSLDARGVNMLVNEGGGDLTTEDHKLLMLALSKLQESEMQLIELRFFEERSFAEVALIAGITENHAKVKVYRILSKLKLILKGSRK
jgi:RNA polymerase sigma-70 factor (ECF subfamily)